MKMSGARAFIKALEDEGVRVIFGIPGGAILPIYDALFDSKKIKHILTRHEQCAAHAADGYARSTGKVGVCMATSGPGATNLVTGIANASMDSIPIVAITGQVATHLVGTDAFQEANITGISLPIVKHSYLVTKPDELQTTVKEAFYIAKTGRPGPVLIDVCVDVSRAEVDYKPHQEINIPGYRPILKGHPRQINEATKAILKSKKPILYVGGGAISSNASREVFELATELVIPVTTTLMGKGIFPETNHLSLGMLGMHGTAYANYSIMEADLIIAVGARFDDRVTGKLSTFAPKAENIIHIDIDPAEIGKNVPVNIPVVGDAKEVLQALLQNIKKLIPEHGKPPRREWLTQIAEWKREFPMVYETDGLRPQYIIEQIYKITKGQALVVTGVGQNQMWSAQYYKTERPRQFISSGGLGTMGFGLPAALGIQVGNPHKIVFDIDGDGSFQMVSQDLTTAVINKLPINIAILNNGYLGMVRQWQELFYAHRYSQTILGQESPDFVKLAEAYGAVGMRVVKKYEVVPALRKAIATPRPVVIDFRIEREENVFPMVPTGAAIHEMIHGKKPKKKPKPIPMKILVDDLIGGDKG